MPQRAPRMQGCSVERTMSLIDGKWKIIVLYKLLRGTLRFNELRRLIPSITQRMLTHQLRELEADGLIVRTVYAQVPPRVEYTLSGRGRSLEPVLTAMKEWGDANLSSEGAEAA
ncbi:winged helix-turn-helix transcriptional regulator [Microvirga mediterraneensis]|uniref:Helix-turn-helix transcriptional regulator n=1 Tax=Microvirga mediterraneensis TaxID=2754695 RepID=A0A838BHR2_9HYPH|nr:helix-turn-helix domain-containing protein [Microvirga mediterraneensis]MBA1155074.1 helix-turn-helix transcriptional regulator [Microvirga mediterraneensis]